ncbi:MAG: hypothetical protein KDB61_07750, partial [Planctomycetes bacterium]|nr:hypothetical protein [Planctomycetota bacterium]
MFIDSGRAARAWRAQSAGMWLLLFLVLAPSTLAEDPAQEPEPDPAHGEVFLPALAGWKANLVLDNGSTGIWTVKQIPVFDTYAVPELVGLDDRGRCNIMVSYSGKWTPKRTIEEGKWLGGLWHGDLDPRAPGAELYTGGALGNLYQVRAYPYGLTDHRLIAQFPGMELHTIVGGDLDPRTPGEELLVFTRPGALYRVRPTGPDGTFESEKLMDLPGRVRDAVPAPDGFGLPLGSLITTTRAGHLGLVYVDKEGPHYEIQYQTQVGLGRLSLRRPQAGKPLVVYAGADDGRILRFERVPEGAWNTSTIYRGPQGTRGVASGRFDANPDVETVAVFGYSAKVQILRRGNEGWTAETIFVDRDK